MSAGLPNPTKSFANYFRDLPNVTEVGTTVHYPAGHTSATYYTVEEYDTFLKKFYNWLRQYPEGYTTLYNPEYLPCVIQCSPEGAQKETTFDTKALKIFPNPGLMIEVTENGLNSLRGISQETRWIGQETFPQALDAALQGFASTTPLRVFNLGCGELNEYSTTIARLSSQFPVIEYYAYDILLSYAATSLKTATPPHTYQSVEGDCTKLATLTKASPQAAHLTIIRHFAENLITTDFLKNAATHLQDKGRILITTYFKHSAELIATSITKLREYHVHSLIKSPYYSSTKQELVPARILPTETVFIGPDQFYFILEKRVETQAAAE